MRYSNHGGVTAFGGRTRSDRPQARPVEFRSAPERGDRNVANPIVSTGNLWMMKAVVSGVPHGMAV